MRYFIYLFPMITVLLTIGCKTSTGVKTVIPHPAMAKVYSLAVSGNLETVVQLLDTLNPNNLSVQERSYRKNMLARFKYKDETELLSTQDTTVIKLVALFRDYWKTAMLNERPLPEADSLFKHKIAMFIQQNHSLDSMKGLAYIKKHLNKYSNSFLQNQGYYANAFGKTAHLYDLFLWKNEEVINYDVELPQDTISVLVHFMSDFISAGWVHYATVGRSQAGGWATKDALYAVKNTYDLDSEQFRVSYLIHEGQHFSDYNRFPQLQQADLEYRAKLAELIYAEETALKLIGLFISQASTSITNPHGFANHCLIRDLSERLFQNKFMTDKELWKKAIAQNKLSETSRLLLQQHAEQLHRLGAKVVRQCIHLG